MKYTGNLCQGCGNAFTDEDDIVVCPECGTPQHRECYDKENRCVCSHLHAEGYAWQGTVNNEEYKPEEKSETVSCPNCGYENPKGTEVCKQCGMKFIFFGMNVVDALHEEEKRAVNKNSDIPDYNAPFTLGKGTGFEEKQANPDSPTPQQVEELITSVLSGNAEPSGENSGRLTLGGPFPPEDKIGGVMTNNVGNFVGTNGMTYISKFKKMERGKKLSFNFAAFFFAPYWFFYRKLYKAGIVVMTCLLASSIIAAPYLYDVMEIYEQFALLVQSGTAAEAQINELYNQLIASSTPVAIYFFATLSINLICGFVANHIYKKYVLEHTARLELAGSKNEAMVYVVKNGGASILIAAAAYFGYQLLTMLVSSLL